MYVYVLLQDYIGVWIINVYVYLFKFDYDWMGGLCGILNGNIVDDFMDRDGNLLSGNEEFN